MTEKLPRLYDDAFDEIISVIERARVRAFRAVNRELIDMYWRVGKYVSHGVADGGWGKAVVEEFSKYIQRQYVGIRGFSPSNIWRMKQFYETYKGEEKLATMLRELSWSHNIQIMACKTNEEREFYLEALDREVKKRAKTRASGSFSARKKTKPLPSMR